MNPSSKPSFPHGQFYPDRSYFRYLLSVAQWTLDDCTPHGSAPLFTPLHAQEVVLEFLGPGTASIHPLRIDNVSDLPSTGRNEIFLACLPDGDVFLRYFNLDAQILFDQKIPGSPEGQRLKDLVTRLWGRKRLKPAAKAKILESVTACTDIQLPTKNEVVFTLQDLNRKGYFQRAFKNFVRDWASRYLSRKESSLQQPATRGDPAITLLDTIADPHQLTGSAALAKTELSRLMLSAVHALPDSPRKTLQLYHIGLQCGTTDPSLQTAAGRQRLKHAKDDCAAQLALYEQAETARGQSLICLLATYLLQGPHRTLVIDHFCHGQRLSKLAARHGGLRTVRTLLLEAGRLLQPCLDSRREEAVSLLPSPLRQRVEAMLSGTSAARLAKTLGCCWKDLDFHLKTLHESLSLVWKAVLMRHSPKGKSSLHDQIEEFLTREERFVSQALWIKELDLWRVAERYQMSEEQVRAHLFRALLRLSEAREALC